jgi:predicted metal-dependent peptidase
VNRRSEILVNPEFFSGLDFREGCWVLLHEVLHAAFYDVRRGEDELFNYVSDGVNNTLLSSWIRPPGRLERFAVTVGSIRSALTALGIAMPPDLEQMTKEEIYRLFPRRGGGGGYGGRIERDLNVDGAGEPVQEGDVEVYGGSTPREVAEGWKREVAKAYTSQKVAGRVPAALQRMVDELLESKVDWRSLLRQAFYNGFGRTVVSTYMRPSRRVDELPGIRRFTLPTVRVLIDTSGSIGERELSQFLGEVRELAGRSPVEARCWDAEAYEAVRVERPGDVLSRLRPYGGGGTVIAPALRKTLEEMRLRDIVVVLTDGEIYDMSSDETVRLFGEVGSRASVAVFCSTHREHDIPGWHFVKVEVD